jgi:tRNA dimethylallyltransferase
VAEFSGRLSLHTRLGRVDAATAARLHPNDLARVVRALEVWELTGRPISAWQKQWDRHKDNTNGVSDRAMSLSDRGPAPRALALQIPRSELYARINARVSAMIAAGLLDEVRGLRQLPQPISREATQALGYKEMFAYLDGQATWEETVMQIQTRSRHFAKRQLTWFRRLSECYPATKELTFALWGLTIK